MLRWETVSVMLAFLAGAVVSAVIILVEHQSSGKSFHLFTTYVSDRPVLNLVLGILAYLPIAAIVPLALLLLTRSGQPPRSLGLVPSFRGSDLGVGIGLAAGAFGTEILLAIAISPYLYAHRHSVNVVHIGSVPKYYIVWGLAISLTTAITEETLVNGYLLTRLEQLGWRDWPALWLSLALRTSYHLYYGLGFLLTVPFGYYATRSFQKHRRLNRVIAAHFFYDSVIFTIAILARR
jgi:membrane protease YdiL (CAAX protease family)